MCHEAWGEPRARPEHDRSPVEIEVEVADGMLPGTLYLPDLPDLPEVPPGEVPAAGRGEATLAEPGRLPCVLVTDIYGTVPFYHEISARLAAAGHPTALIDLFWREGGLPELTREAAFERRSRMDEPRGIADVSAAVDHLEARFGAARAGVVGFCLGGLFALVLSARRTDLATVSYYGFPKGIPAPVRVASPRPIDLVDQMTGPILAFWGDGDPIGVETMQRFGSALAQHEVAYDAVIYPGAGHGFLQGLVDERDDSPAATDSWKRTLALLADHPRSS